MAVHEHLIWRFIKDNGGRVTKQQIFEALGYDEESRKSIEEKLRMMTSMGLVTARGDEIRIK